MSDELLVEIVEDGAAVECIRCGERIERGNVIEATAHVVVCRPEADLT